VLPPHARIFVIQLSIFSDRLPEWLSQISADAPHATMDSAVSRPYIGALFTTH
jgi:hypothetical protein